MPNRLDVSSTSKNHYFNAAADIGKLRSPYLHLPQITEKDEEVHSGEGSQYQQSHGSRLTSILDNSDKMEAVIFKN